jgi:hypothetical protein
VSCDSVPPEAAVLFRATTRGGTMPLHKLCNEPERAVVDMLEGVVALNPCASMLDAFEQVSSPSAVRHRAVVM